MAEQSCRSISLKNVSVSIGGVKILDRVEAFIPGCGSTAVVGPNGAGKTTLLHAIMGKLLFEGEIDIVSQIKSGKIRLGFVPQRFSFDRSMPLTVMEMLCSTIQKRPLFLGISESLKQKMNDLLSSVGAQHLSKRRMGALSGGELQRVLLANAIRQKPDILILDEPASGVDIRGEAEFCELLDFLREKEGFTQLLVTHDLSYVTAHADHVICLNRNVKAQGKPSEVLTHEVLASTFGLHEGLPDRSRLPDSGDNDAS